MKLKERVGEIGRMIQSGQRLKARELLESLNPSRVERGDALELAMLARRVELADLSLRLLHPYVRPSHRKLATATDAERAEYAASLAILGMASEALLLLRQIDAEKSPQVLLYQTFAHASQWDYAATVPLLEKYVSHPFLTDYQRLVGKVNLAAALNFQRKSQFLDVILNEIVAEAEAGGHRLLEGNALEIGAQDALYRKDWDLAETRLGKAETLLKEAGGFDAFFTRKWRSVIDFWRKPSSAAALKALHATKAEAESLRHWETARDIDRVETIVTGNRQLLAHLCFGTPHLAFRRKLLNETGKPAIPETYEWAPLPSPTVWVDIFSGTSSGKGKGLKVGQVPHRILSTLASDFYRPFTMHVLFSRVFEGEFYDPFSSGARIHQGVVLLKKWFTQNKIPLSIVHDDGTFSLAWKGPCSIKLARTSQALDSESLQIERLRRWKGEFTVAEACEFLDSSHSSVLRVLKTASDRKELEKVGKGRATRYLFKQSNKKSA